MTSEPEELERSDGKGSEPHSMELNSQATGPHVLRHRPFACWQIATVALVTGFLGAGALIAINLCLMGHRVLAIMIFIVSAMMGLATFGSAPIQALWLLPLVSYFFARLLFQWEYAPFRKSFTALSKPSERNAPLWYAFGYAIASWGVVLFAMMLAAVCMDLGLLSSRKPQYDEVEIPMAPAIQEPQFDNQQSEGQNQFKSRNEAPDRAQNDENADAKR